ncbi:hypothetical protein BGU98_00075 [Clostridioides difficile]|nr:hypothetical protein BGU98_00075 [Clostridioides difficile]
MERGKFVVNEQLETNGEGRYAIGDIIDTPFRAHVGSKEGIGAVENALVKTKVVDYRSNPSCVYTAPDVAAVATTE